MKLIAVMMLSAVMVVSVISSAAAQQGTTSRIPTVEELFLSAPDMGAFEAR